VTLSAVYAGTDRYTDARPRTHANRDRPTAYQDADRHPDTRAEGDTQSRVAVGLFISRLLMGQPTSSVACHQRGEPRRLSEEAKVSQEVAQSTTHNHHAIDPTE
jgi:hypothetical protein